MAPVERAEYENVSGHIIGIVRINNKGEENGHALEAGDHVWLSEEERRATARAPKDPADNPFANGYLRKISDFRVTDADDRPIDAGTEATVPPRGEEPVTAIGQGTLPAGGDLGPVSPEQKAAIEAAAGTLQPPPPAPQAPPTEPGKPVATAAVHEEEQAVKTAPPEHAETGAAVEPQGPPPEGEYAAKEEVATPDAQEKAAAIRRTPSGAAEKPPAVPTPGGHHKPQSQGS